MVISVGILWYFKNWYVLIGPTGKQVESIAAEIAAAADTAATATDAPPHGVSDQDEGGHAKGAGGDAGRSADMLAVPNWKRVMALIVIFLIVIVFWMVFHQNGSTLTYFADDNTDWNVTGTISNSINAFWVLALTFPLVWFWGFLDRRGKEPATPTKMAFGMTLTGLSFLVLWYGASIGEKMTKTPEQLAAGEFRINERVAHQSRRVRESRKTYWTRSRMRKPAPPTASRTAIWNSVMKFFSAKQEAKKIVNGVKFSRPAMKTSRRRTKKMQKLETALTEAEKTRMRSGQEKLIAAVNAVARAGDANRAAILQNAYLFRVSPFWLVLAYAIVTLGELMLSPMGLSLVSKVAPISIRGLMMGGWFVATAIGNKLTQIGVYWDIWLQSSFFLVLALMALFMAVVLAILLRPLKKAMPGV